MKQDLTQFNPLGDISPETFLKEYWQKKPLVIRQAFPDFQCPITAEELAGLSCEEDVNSRIILEKDGEHPWQPVFGPMEEDIFSDLPETHWTLAINDLEKVIPELAWLPDLFRFIPDWRFDDLMSSYAADQGSVGPHFDLYDVFIIQGSGRRRWQVSSAEVSEDNQVTGTPLRIQNKFVAEQEWILETGDMIYIPPNVSHHGVSLGESISFSVGYRAVSHADMLNDFIAHITQHLSPKLTYKDTDLKYQEFSSEITADAIERVSDIFSKYLPAENSQIIRWFGRYVSDTKYDNIMPADEPVETIGDITAILSNGECLLRHPASRFAYFKDTSNTLLFINGHDYNVSEEFAKQLCQERTLEISNLKNFSTNEKQLLIELFNTGSIYISE